MTALNKRREYVMDRVKIDLKNCYGIKALENEFDFSTTPAYALYAPNGAMKSSLAQTFQDVAKGVKSVDRLFPTRATVRRITDETGNEVDSEKVFVVVPYNDSLGHTAKTSTLLVDASLREEYTQLYVDIEKAKQALLAAIKQQSNSKKDMEAEISSAFTPTPDSFYTALRRIQWEVGEQRDTPFANVLYDKIFDDKVITALNAKDLKTAIEEYVKRYNELLSTSTYFRKGTFDYYNASEIARSLSDNGFFSAKHTVTLKSEGKTLEITTEKELESVIAKEKESIIKDNVLRKRFDGIAKQLTKNVTLRSFQDYMLSNEALVSQLNNLDKFKQDILKSYVRANHDLFVELMDKYEASEKRRKEIEEEAQKQRTQWENVIDMFNSRFFVPFTLDVKNRTAVMLGNDSMISLGFTYHDDLEKVSVEKSALLEALSTGEKRALYILNVLFEVETRKKERQETIVIVDDIADSFDYQNKYAIVQYLKDISQDGLFKQIIMTHNFDFFRTLESRFVGYKHCLMAIKSGAGIILERAHGIKNIFVNDWKKRFFIDPKKKIASICFLRNLVEFSEGDKDIKFQKLTSLLHWKIDTHLITVAELDDIYNTICKSKGTSTDGHKPVWELIQEEASNCLQSSPGINFENKIVLAIAIRLTAERFMVGKLNDTVFAGKIEANQTHVLAAEYQRNFAGDPALSILDKVLLMTPENIHLNSFMYEPIIDMSDEHLKRLYHDVRCLAQESVARGGPASQV